MMESCPANAAPQNCKALYLMLDSSLLLRHVNNQSSRAKRCPLLPSVSWSPYAEAAKKKGVKVYHLNIGQPDIETPKAALDAVRHADFKVLNIVTVR